VTPRLRLSGEYRAKRPGLAWAGALLAGIAFLGILGLTAPGRSQSGRRTAAERMIRASRRALAPVYAPLAKQIAGDFKLAGRKGIGIDVGSGPGTLIVELCKRTELHWINADINPHFFPHFFRLAEERGVGGRVSAIYADAKALPFRNDYADVIVSRGSYHFWGDRKKGFREIYRVLKPGGIAFIGRGLPRSLPLETAKRIRATQGGGPKYNRDEEAEALRRMMVELGIRSFRVHTPKAPSGADVNHGVWVEFHKPKSKAS
jgi:SAM-dependent methyltransferase